MSHSAQTKLTHKPVDPMPPQPPMHEVKAKMKATWEDGNYASFAKYMENGAIEILENWGLPKCQRLLDVGCGSGQSAIPAAQQGHNVVGIDIAENLIDHANARAEEEKLSVIFEVADAEALPYEDADFDTVISMIGAMFAPQPSKVVSEMARVLRPGGKLCMANWTADSMPAQMFKCVAGIIPPPPGFISPILWGDETTVIERLSPFFSDIELTRKIYPQWHYPFSIDGIVDLFKTHFGPIKRAFDQLEEDWEETENLRQRLFDIYKNNCQISPDEITTITGGEYLEIIATRRN